MAEEEGKKEEKFDFTVEGEALGYISLDQARVLTFESARTKRGRLRVCLRDVPTALEVIAPEDTEDHTVRLGQWRAGP